MRKTAMTFAVAGWLFLVLPFWLNAPLRLQVFNAGIGLGLLLTAVVLCLPPPEK